MQKRISTLAGIVIIAIAAVVIFGGIFAWQYISKSQIPTPNTQSNLNVQNQNTETADWKTYKNDEYGFEIKYPKEFTGSVSEIARSVGVLLYGENSEKLGIKLNLNKNFDKDALVPNRNSVDYAKSETTINGIKSYRVKETICYMGCGASVAIFIPLEGKQAIVLWLLRSPDTGWPTDSEAPKITDQEEKIFDKIISTFKFITPTNNQTTDAPVIESILPSSGSKGTIVEIRGKNLSGFEGDLDIYFERADGKKTMLTDTFGDYAKTQDKLIKVKIVEPCQAGEKVTGRYSGTETLCDYIELTPGTYKVYVEPWGKRSNIVNFEIIKN